METKEYSNVTLENLNNGAAGELFQEEFRKVLANIADLSVESDHERQIKLVISIKPTKNRESATTTIEASTKLAPPAAHEGAVFFGFRGNKAEAYISNRRQLEMFDEKPAPQRTKAEDAANDN